MVCSSERRENIWIEQTIALQLINIVGEKTNSAMCLSPDKLNNRSLLQVFVTLNKCMIYMTTLYRYTGLMNTLRKPIKYFSVTDNSPVL